MGEETVPVQGLLKDQRKPILDAARNRRWEEVGDLLDEVSDVTALVRFRMFADANWRIDLRGDTKTLVADINRRIAVVGGGEVAAFVPAPAVKSVEPAASVARGPAQGAQPKAAPEPQAPRASQAPTSGATPGGFRGKVAIEGGDPAAVASAVSAATASAASKPSAPSGKREQPPAPPSRGPAPGAKPRTDTYASPVTHSREGRR